MDQHDAYATAARATGRPGAVAAVADAILQAAGGGLRRTSLPRGTMTTGARQARVSHTGDGGA
jgi:hypothetical protein